MVTSTYWMLIYCLLIYGMLSGLHTLEAFNPHNNPMWYIYYHHFVA